MVCGEATPREQHGFYIGTPEGVPAWSVVAATYYLASPNGRGVIANFCSGKCSLIHHQQKEEQP